METKQKIFVTIGTAAVVAVAVIGGASLYNGASSTQTNNSVPQVSQSTSSETTSTSTTSTTGSTTQYKDGTYTKTISYSVPHGGSNSIKVTLTVSNGVITSATTTNSYTDGESEMYISSFENSVTSNANSKSLADYSPSRIGGASLTTEAFAEAVSSIRSDAAA